MKTWISLVLFVFAMWISFSEFLRRDILISKSFALLFFLAALYLFVISVIDLIKKSKINSSKADDYFEK